MAKKWYVLHTYSGYENKVRQNLEQRIESMGLEDKIFKIEIPTETVTEIKEGGKRVESEKKVLPGYVLIRMELDPQSWAVVRNTPGVTGFVGQGSDPIPLTPEEVARMGIEKTDIDLDVEIGDTVRVISGPFETMMGEVTEINPDKQVLTVKISAFGRDTPVELEFTQVDKML